MKTGYIYIHKNKINNKSYIGSSTQKSSRRWRKRDNTYNSYKNCSVFYKALQKYGWDNFESEILEKNISFDQISKREEYYINFYKSIAPNGYNTVDIIDGRTVFSNETKQKISEKRKKYYQTIDEPIVAYNRKDHILINNVEYKNCSKCKMNKILTDFCKNNKTWDGLHRYCNDCWREYSQKSRNKKEKKEMKSYSKERIDNMRQGVLRAYANNPDIKKKLAKARSKPLIGRNILNGDILRFDSGLHAKSQGFNNTNITKAMKHNKPYKGYLWSYDLNNNTTNTNSDHLIFESEKNNPIKVEIWNSILNKNKAKIYARNCIIQRINSYEQREFLDNNHLQGDCKGARASYGLFFNEELVAVMTFGIPRFKKHAEWEMHRFCSKKNISIVGGASKLLAAFINDYNPNSIVSYANKRFSKGNLYKSLGWTYVGDTCKGYYYEKDGKIEHRTKYQKHKLPRYFPNVDMTLTEKEIMINEGYKIIKDSGNMIFIWKKTS